MLNKFIVFLVSYLLKNKKIKSDDKTKVISLLIRNIGALPLSESFTFSAEGTILLNGKELKIEQAIDFRESCRNLKESFARNLINEQLKFLAIQNGVFQGLNPEMIMFSKAALWVIQEENNLLSKILQE